MRCKPSSVPPTRWTGATAAKAISLGSSLRTGSSRRHRPGACGEAGPRPSRPQGLSHRRQACAARESGLPAAVGLSLALAAAWPCTRWGLPCRSPHGGRGALLPHLFTLTSRRRGVGRRCIFCGTFPVPQASRRCIGGPPGRWALPTTAAQWCSDFPPPAALSGERPSTHPAKRIIQPGSACGGSFRPNPAWGRPMARSGAGRGRDVRASCAARSTPQRRRSPSPARPPARTARGIAPAESAGPRSWRRCSPSASAA